MIKALAIKRYGMTQGDLFKAAELSMGGSSTLILEELEECGFITSFPEYGKIVKDKHWRLTDEYSLFYLNWIAKMRSSILRGSESGYWIKQQKTQNWLSWAGYSFENVCLKHVAGIKKALGLGGVSTIETQWANKGDKNTHGAQIDLVIDRADNCINLCEIKFCNDTYVIKKQEKEELHLETGTRKTLFTTMITPYGVEENNHYLEVVQNQLLMDDLFQ